jgi:CDP-glycerol glycerophosphotransferase (TagB/SpsB family)
MSKEKKPNAQLPPSPKIKQKQSKAKQIWIVKKRRKQKQAASFRSRLREFSFLSWPIDERGYHVLRHNETKRRGRVVRKSVVVVAAVKASRVCEKQVRRACRIQFWSGK